MCQDKPDSSCKLKGAYRWNSPFINVAAQACGMGVIPDMKPCKANSRAAAQANLIQPRYLSESGQSVEADEACHRWSSNGRSSHRTLRGGWGQRARIEESRNLGDPRCSDRSRESDSP